MISPELATTLIEAAKPHYNYDLAYHNWDHAAEVMSNVEALSGRAQKRGLRLGTVALIVAGAWHDTGYPEDHLKLGFETKEHYSAALFSEYAKHKKVPSEDTLIIVNSILGTIHNAPRHDLNSLALHRSDVENIGGDYEAFVKNNIALWHESGQLGGVQPSWQEHVAGSRGFINGLIAESIKELPRLGEHIRVADSFDTLAARNSLRLETEPEPPRA